MDESGHGARCSRCGSGQVAWRVRRLRPAGQRVSHLTLGMACRACGLEWEESLGPEDRGDPETRGDAPGEPGGPGGARGPARNREPPLPAES